MPEGFVSLEELLRVPTRDTVVAAEPAACEAAADSGVRDDRGGDADSDTADRELRELVAEVRCFRARLAEARELACERVSAEPADEDIVRVRVHPDDIAALHASGLRVTADARLRRGDVAFDLCDGVLDATLGARLDAVLRATRS